MRATDGRSATVRMSVLDGADAGRYASIAPEPRELCLLDRVASRMALTDG